MIKKRRELQTTQTTQTLVALNQKRVLKNKAVDLKNRIIKNLKNQIVVLKNQKTILRNLIKKKSKTKNWKKFFEKIAHLCKTIRQEKI